MMLTGVSGFCWMLLCLMGRSGKIWYLVSLCFTGLAKRFRVDQEEQKEINNIFVDKRSHT